MGGAVYALYPGAARHKVLRAIVALQTISDYLDNLCDRLQVFDESAFRTLHLSFQDALRTDGPSHRYYAEYPYTEQVYLPRLVRVCQESLRCLPHYGAYQEAALYLGEQYCQLQVLKHLGPQREQLLKEWIDRSFPAGLRWQEWAAACGSTLAIFFCFALASSEPRVTPEAVLDAYFPWIQGLHILLDYVIDQDEDARHGDLNFTFYYPSRRQLSTALQVFAAESRSRAANLPNPEFHLTVVDGLLALYGSDPKAKLQNHTALFRRLSRGSYAAYYLPACAILRRLGVLS